MSKYRAFSSFRIRLPMFLSYSIAEPWSRCTIMQILGKHRAVKQSISLWHMLMEQRHQAPSEAVLKMCLVLGEGKDTRLCWGWKDILLSRKGHVDRDTLSPL